MGGLNACSANVGANAGHAATVGYAATARQPPYVASLGLQWYNDHSNPTYTTASSPSSCTVHSPDTVVIRSVFKGPEGHISVLKASN